MGAVATNIVKGFNLAKIDLAKVNILELRKTNQKEMVLIDVLAFVTSFEVTKNKKDDTKTSLKFSGQFEITSRVTGESVVASSAFFPGPAEGFLKGLVEGLEGGAARLAFQVTVLTDKHPDSPTGYKFGMKLYTDKDTQADPFKELRGNFPEMVPMIAAPKAGAKK